MLWHKVTVAVTHIKSHYPSFVIREHGCWYDALMLLRVMALLKFNDGAPVRLAFPELAVGASLDCEPWRIQSECKQPVAKHHALSLGAERQ
jgi:hypothetical protein